MAIGVWISLTLYFLLMLAIGFYAMRQATSSSQQYLLADRNLHPAVAALSAGASDMSGWLLLGLPGAIFIAGLQEARSEEHTSELQSLMRISYAVFCLKKKMKKI